MYNVVVKKVHVRYLISWWVSCQISRKLVSSIPVHDILQYKRLSTKSSAIKDHKFASKICTCFSKLILLSNVTKCSHYRMLFSPERSWYSWTTPTFLTLRPTYKKLQQTSSGFSPIVNVPAVIKHNLCLIRKYHRFPFLCMKSSRNLYFKSVERSQTVNRCDHWRWISAQRQEAGIYCVVWHDTARINVDVDGVWYTVGKRQHEICLLYTSDAADE